MIVTEQNTEKQIQRLAAQRQLYSTAKTIFGWQVLLGGPIAVASAVLVLLHPEFRGHIAIWALFEPSKLSAPALRLLQDTQAAGGRILVSTITPIEMTYLTERGRIPAIVLPGLWDAITDPTKLFDVLPISADVARVLKHIPRDVVPDMPDRIIAATALAFGLPLVSADQRVRALSLQGLSIIW